MGGRERSKERSKQKKGGEKRRKAFRVDRAAYQKAQLGPIVDEVPVGVYRVRFRERLCDEAYSVT